MRQWRAASCCLDRRRLSGLKTRYFLPSGPSRYTQSSSRILMASPSRSSICNLLASVYDFANSSCSSNKRKTVDRPGIVASWQICLSDSPSTIRNRSRAQSLAYSRSADVAEYVLARFSLRSQFQDSSRRQDPCSPSFDGTPLASTRSSLVRTLPMTACPPSLTWTCSTRTYWSPPCRRRRRVSTCTE
jgi:hypothetical protein